MIGAIVAFVSRWAVTALCALLALALVAVGVQTIRLKSLQASTAQALADAATVARTKEQDWQTNMSRIRDEKDAEIEHVVAARDAALASLRSRPARLPQAARPACQGSTGAELSGGDAEFLVRLAGRADSLRAELAACYKREDALSQ